jgi:hypothetical protein
LNQHFWPRTYPKSMLSLETPPYLRNMPPKSKHCPAPVLADAGSFEQWVRHFPYFICFVHSPWSIYSKAALWRFNALQEQFPHLQYVQIDNRSARSFIYDWLHEQQEQHATPADLAGPRYGSWKISGNGELFGVRDGQLDWFEWSLNFVLVDELQARGWLGG